MGIRDQWQRFKERFRKPAMVGTPPSQRPMWHDPTEHAKDFAKRYAEPLNYHVENRMMELGIPDDQIGAKNVGYGPPRLAFQPHGMDGGNIHGNGEIVVDSGLLNDDLLRKDYGDKAATRFADSSLRHRLDAILTHEFEEHRHGMDHEAAVKFAPGTDLPISHQAREILRAMRKGWRGK
jgi:hypothetical protein